MTERKNNQNTLIDYAFKASVFAVAFSIIFSLFISINNNKNIAYAVVVDDVSKECQAPQITSPLTLSVEVANLNSGSNSNVVYQIKSNPSEGVTYGVNGNLPLGLSLFDNVIYGDPQEGTHSIEIFAQNDCGKDTKTLNIDLSVLPGEPSQPEPTVIKPVQNTPTPINTPFIDLSCKIISNNQTGWYGTYFNYSSTTPGMELPTSKWSDSYGDPLSVSSAFTANWYGAQYSRFSRVDNNLNFGTNFFPFNAHPEELKNGNEYYFGVRWEADVLATSTGSYNFTLTSDDDAWVYVNGQLVADNSGVHADEIFNGSVNLNVGPNLVQIFFAERHTTQSTMNFSFADYSLLIKPHSDVCPKNTPPTITLIGANPATTTVGTIFTDPGATANDLEDGNLTPQIVVTGTVDINTVGTYTLTYTVTDTGGLTASTTRQVVVTSKPTVPPVTPSTVKINLTATKIVCNAESDLPNWGLGGSDISSTTATDFISSHPNCHLEPNWKFQWASATTTDPDKTFIGEAPGWNTFGPTNLSGVATTSIELATSTSYIWVREVLKDGYIPFTYPDTNNNVSAEMYCHIDVLNYDNYDKVEGPFVQNKNYNCIALNALKTVIPPTNTPPTITLIGANPATTTVGTIFTDPGATANDLEDGNLTPQIVVTGTVDINTVGTYTLTYTVTDTGGLTASTTRQVVVEKIVVPVNRKINVCLVLANENNQIATTSSNLPSGQFSIDLGESGAGATTTLSWNATTFSPNRKTILGVNDSDCKELPNLSLGDYLYTQVSTTGPAWLFDVKYNDQSSQPVNNVFDFFPYQSGNPLNDNSDGLIKINDVRPERTLVLFVAFDSKYNQATNTPPTITLIGANPATTTVGTIFTDPGATANDLEDGNLTPQIVVTGTVDINTVGTYTLTYTVTDTGGLTASTTRQVVVTSGGGQCLIPDITSPLTASVQVNSVFTYTLTASSTATTTISVATSTLPAGLTYSNGVISGTPTAVGTYNITLEAGNSCGLRTETLVLTVTDVPPPVCVGCGGGSGGGGGGGGGGNGPINSSLTIFNEYVQEVEPGVAMVTWNTNVPATREVVYGNNSNSIIGLAPLYGYTSNTEKIITPLSTTHSMVVSIDPNKVYYFRPVSSDSDRIVVGKELNITRGSAPITTGGSCYYLYDFLRKDFNNNPVEVRKLQVFLNSLEGFTNLQITGVYDDATVAAVDAFQNKYKADILTPWGHTAPTGYTYILTKKKVNEIYCQRAFPVTALEQTEIDQFRDFLLGLQNAGIQLDNGVATPPENPVNVPIQNEIIGLNGGNGNNIGNNTNEEGTSTITTLAGVSSTTRSIVSNLTANVLEGGKSFLNLALGMFGWPLFDMNDSNSRIFGGEFQCKWVILILIILILAVLYFWYKEYKNNKKLEEINKEIDLD